jgi:hypothetical protein
MDIQATLAQAVAAAREGRKAEARHLLESILNQDERNEQAWLWLSGVVDDEEERLICLENVLAINPHNEMVRKGLVALQAGDIPRPSVSSPEPSQGQTSLAEREPPPASPAAALTASPEANLATDHASPDDRRVFIGITIALMALLICIVLSIVIFVIVMPMR